MLDLLPETKCVGEVGLDFTTNDGREREFRQKVFTSILGHYAKFSGKALTVQSRRARATSNGPCSG